jgi:hypothetical protein
MLSVAEMFQPHPNLSNEINGRIVESEIEGGVYLEDLAIGARLEVKTANRTYVLENRGDGRVLISGHPRYCPQEVEVELHGSTWRQAMIKMHFIGRGMYLEFRHPEHGIMRTSKIVEIRELTPRGASHLEPVTRVS